MRRSCSSDAPISLKNGLIEAFSCLKIVKLQVFEKNLKKIEKNFLLEPKKSAMGSERVNPPLNIENLINIQQVHS